MSLFRVLLAVLAATLTLTSCQKPEDNTNELGEPTTIEQIQKAQIESVVLLTPDQIKVGETVHMIESQEIVTSQGPLISLLSEWVAKVTQLEETSNAVFVTMDKQLIDHTLPDKPKYEFTDVFGFAKAEKTARAEPTDYKLSAQLFASDTPAKKPATVSITDVSFHNLRKQKVVLIPPEKVMSSPNCRGLNPCSITADQINYDIVFYMSDGTRAKHQIEWQISTQVPFFSSILKQCASTVVAVDSVRVLVKQCQQVVDFTN